ncbi:hypothetical protein DTO217A2_7978 [Paecilomyces variotii]|nr:hypothetical protein DTO217A2_7978 [Paecilomyces variotii]
MKRRQWAVFCASTILVILFWAVTPLQSGIFAVTSVSRTQVQPMIGSVGFISLEEQADKLNLDFVNDGHDIIWLGQKLPSFTTMKYTLAPFLPSAESTISGSNKTWTGNTILYDTTLTCESPASISRTPNDTGKVTPDDGHGCSAPGILDSCTVSGPAGSPPNISMSYTSVCNPNAHKFLAAVRWDDGSCLLGVKSNSSSSVMFCHAEYFQQSVEATVRLPDLSVQSVRPISEKKELLMDSFNFTLFEEIIVNQVVPQKHQNNSSPQAVDHDRADISAATILSQDVILQKLNVISVSKMVPFAVQLSGLPASSLFQPENLQNAFEDAHQLLFALAVQEVLRAPSNTTSDMTGIAESSVGAVIMVPVFTYLVIGFLSLIIMFSIILLCIYRSRKLNLPYGPNSIASTIALLHRVGGLVLACQSITIPGTKAIRKVGRRNYSHLQSEADGGQLKGALVSEVDDTVEAKPTSSHKPTAWPWELSSLGGIPFIVTQAASIAAVVLLHKLVLKNNGLALPSENQVIQQIVLNFIPTALGTILEPFWVVLNRFLCIIQPFIELRKGATAASKSALLEYTSLPPQLAFFQAMSAQHWLLAALCAISASANLLTVGLSGLFEIQDTYQNSSVIMTQNLSLAVVVNEWTAPDGQGGYPLQTMRANLSENVPLLPWLSPEYYFLPLSIPPKNETTDTSYRVRTSGLGSRLDCQQLRENDQNLGYTFTLNHDATEANFTATETLSDGTKIRCYSPNAFTGDNAKVPAEATQIYLRGPPEGKKALELFIQPISSFVSATREEKFACPRRLIAGWVRSSISLGEEFSETLYGPTRNITKESLNSTFMMCKPKFQTAEFDVTIDQQGHILGYTQKTDLTEPENDVLAWAIWNATTFLVGAPPGYLEWHNDTYAADWMNLFLKQYMKSTSLLDANVPLPGFSRLVDLVEYVYGELFAIILQSNDGLLLPAPQVKSVVATEVMKVPKVFLSMTMVYIVLATLSAGLMVAICFYILLPKPFMPHIPTSLAALASDFSHSHILHDLDKAEVAEDKTKMVRFFEEKGPVYGFGRYMGTDGEVHIGIDRQPYIVPQNIDQVEILRRLKITGILNKNADIDSGMI